MDEKKPIIRMYFVKIKETFVDLSEEEKMEFMHKDRENMDGLGMKQTMLIDCRWSNEEWDYIGIKEWPTLEALVKRAKFEKEEIETFRYVESKTYLGTLEIGKYGKK
ncbi:hypothetical protein [Methanococcoides alaskense]|uniref:Uncharacterized protein n=1 Tax=Methanococcoides alaskense TaxID=325778 RepID=A0AA90U157_9EURY|nr:hypothetical protein [Methanococcoides alaskense]MDA0525808.1 hypothetical protein [Methanococcoides alaskense]MDR6223966.1 hypothetical protein [Methanococcoides alaskense]